MASPMVQLVADAANSAHAARVRPADLTAAIARLTAAIPLATPSPMSSIAIVVLSPPRRNAVQMRNSTEATRASAAASANRLHSRERAARRRKLEIIRVVLSAEGCMLFSAGRSAGEVCQATYREPYVNSNQP